MNKKEWEEEFNKAKKLLPNCNFQWVLKNYIAFKIRGPDFVIVAYPHTTTAGNQHIRIRDENSKNKYQCVCAMAELDSSENSCTFHVKKWPDVPGHEIARELIYEQIKRSL